MMTWDLLALPERIAIIKYDNRNMYRCIQESCVNLYYSHRKTEFVNTTLQSYNGTL